MSPIELVLVPLYSHCCPAQDSFAGQLTVNRKPGQLMKTESDFRELYLNH